MNSTKNIYKNDVDFGALALQSADFAKHLKQNNQLDFSDPGAVRELTKALLHVDFGLDVELPEDRLCPPVPNRFNYILWLQDLIDTTSEEYLDSYDQDRDVVGLDVGTGSSCIYPLLGCSQRPSWRFVATEIDEVNLRYAAKNVDKNKLQSRIRIVTTAPEEPLIPLGTKIPLETMDFTMCNPPFYESQDELLAAAKAKQRPPFSACTGAAVEMVTSGGEVAFVSRMIKESLQLRDRVQWYTSMLGKLSSVSVLVEKLLETGNQNWAVTEFVQGTKTRRWAIAWSWMDLRPTAGVARNISNIPRHLLPFPSEFTFHATSSSISTVSQTINSEISSLHIPWRWDTASSTGLGFAMENVWSRQARRKRQHAASATEGEGSVKDPNGGFNESDAAFGFKVMVRRKEGVGDVEVLVRWVTGFDSVLFESFCGMLKRKAEGR